MKDSEFLSKLRYNIRENIDGKDGEINEYKLDADNVQTEIESILKKENDKKFNPFLNKAVAKSIQKSHIQTTDLISNIYAIKIGESLPSLLSFHNKLTEIGATDHFNAKRYQEFGDNYYTAKTIKKNIDENQKSSLMLAHIEKGGKEEDFQEPVYKIIIAENQSPMYALVVEEPELYKQKEQIHFIRIKNSYNSPEKLEEFFNLFHDDKFNNDYEWFIENNISRSYGLITSVDTGMETCNKIQNIQEIENCLFNIYQGLDSFDQNTEINLC